MDLAAMSEAKVLVLASSLLCAKMTSLSRWILSCGKNNGMASTMAAIMSLAYRSSRRTSSPPTGGLYYDADAAALGSQSSTTQPPHLPAEEVRWGGHAVADEACLAGAAAAAPVAGWFPQSRRQSRQPHLLATCSSPSAHAPEPPPASPSGLRLGDIV